MTNEECAKILQQVKDGDLLIFDKNRMAINSPTSVSGTSDLIRRQDAIDAFWKLDVEIRPSAIDAITKMLEGLPSAQPNSKVSSSTQKALDNNLPSAQPDLQPTCKQER